MTSRRVTYYVATVCSMRRRLRPHCERLDVTLEHLSRLSGLPLDTLRKIDLGRRDPLVTTALRIARVLDVEVEDLFAERPCR